jgi:thioredoxin reductase (NADPH)
MTARTPLERGEIASRADFIFPTLTPAQIDRIRAHGSERTVRAGEILVEEGALTVPFFVVKTGEIGIFRVTGCEGEEVVAVHRPGQFTGEVNMLSGRRSLFQMRVLESGEVIEMDRHSLQSLVQTDFELSEIVMRAFILRRLELVAAGLGDVAVLGSLHNADTLRIREFLTRNSHPYTYIDLDVEPDIQVLLDRFHVAVADVPVVICRGVTVLRNPTNQKIAECLGFNAAIDSTHVRDVVIVGAGPAGLAAAVYGASEGLDVLVVEATAPGGQAGSSSKIENYLGFPTGISGQELAGRAYTQAQKFGAQIAITRGATQLTCDRKPYTIAVGSDDRIPSRVVVIATGAEYRKLPLENLQQFEGAGIYYGATFVEAQSCGGAEVVVVGGGNSAGQAAVFLAQTAAQVHVVVRSNDLAARMSRYLIRRIEDNPKITVHTRTEIVALEGNGHLEQVRLANRDTGTTEALKIQHVFVMTGAAPKTEWLAGCVTLDAKGFIKTGTDLSAEDLKAARWPLPRPPHLLETSLPGVFAVGDVRCGNVKRVAAAVGEGSIAISFVHQVLRE